MPFVNIKVTNEGVSADQKAALIKGVTDLLANVLGKDPAITVNEWSEKLNANIE